MIELLLMNPATSCTPEQSFSTARRLKTWHSSTIRNRRFIFPSILNIHKGLTDEINETDELMKLMNLYHCLVVIISTSVCLWLQILTSRYYYVVWPLFPLSMYTAFLFYIYLHRNVKKITTITRYIKNCYT